MLGVLELLIILFLWSCYSSNWAKCNLPYTSAIDTLCLIPLFIDSQVLLFQAFHCNSFTSFPSWNMQYFSVYSFYSPNSIDKAVKCLDLVLWNSRNYFGKKWSECKKGSLKKESRSNGWNIDIRVGLEYSHLDLPVQKAEDRNDCFGAWETEATTFLGSVFLLNN